MDDIAKGSYISEIYNAFAKHWRKASRGYLRKDKVAKRKKHKAKTR